MPQHPAHGAPRLSVITAMLERSAQVLDVFSQVLHTSPGQVALHILLDGGKRADVLLVRACGTGLVFDYLLLPLYLGLLVLSLLSRLHCCLGLLSQAFASIRGLACLLLIGKSVGGP